MKVTEDKLLIYFSTDFRLTQLVVTYEVLKMRFLVVRSWIKSKVKR